MKLTRANLWRISQAGRANFQLDSEAKWESGGWGPSYGEEGDVRAVLGDGGTRWHPAAPRPVAAPSVMAGSGGEGLEGRS